MKASFLFLAACAATAATPVFPVDNRWRAVPMHVWHTHDLGDDGDLCEPYWLQPGMLCVGNRELRYDCRWRCVDLVMME
jgi:hypothetical protein